MMEILQLFYYIYDFEVIKFTSCNKTVIFRYIYAGTNLLKVALRLLYHILHGILLMSNFDNCSRVLVINKSYVAVPCKFND